MATVVAGVVLLGGPASAQEDPCAPGPDGAVPEMCQSGMPVSDTGTVGIDPDDPCFGSQPVEPGDGVVSSDEGIAVGEPAPGSDPERVDPEQVDPSTVDDTARTAGPGAVGPDTVICAFGVPVSAPVAPESTAGGGTAVDSAAGQLPRTGPEDRLLALAAAGGGLLVVGAGAAAVGRRRRTADL